MQVTHTQAVTLITSASPITVSPVPPNESVITRMQRAHYRLSWKERFSRNARLSTAQPLTVTLYGLPDPLALRYGFALLPGA